MFAGIAGKYLMEGVGIEETRVRLLFIEAKTRIVPVDSELALRAGETFLELCKVAGERGLRTPSLVDAIVYATARIVGEDLVTGDRLFKDLPLVAYIGD